MIRSRTQYAPAGRVRVAEVVSALSQALDLGSGSSQWHSVRTCVLGMRIAAELQLPDTFRSELLLAQIFDYILLPLIHPTGQHDHNELKGIEHLLRHLVIVSPRLQSFASVPLIRVFGPYGEAKGGEAAEKEVELRIFLLRAN